VQSHSLWIPPTRILPHADNERCRRRQKHQAVGMRSIRRRTNAVARLRMKRHIVLEKGRNLGVLIPGMEAPIDGQLYQCLNTEPLANRLNSLCLKHLSFRLFENHRKAKRRTKRAKRQNICEESEREKVFSSLRERNSNNSRIWKWV
jgi:hypothetical protein